MNASIARSGVLACTMQLIPNATNFPSGMPSLVDYVHSKGLKFGICDLNRDSDSRFVKLTERLGRLQTRPAAT